MRSDIPRRSVTVSFDLNRYEEVWRLTAYATENCLIEMQLKQLRIYQLSPLDLMIFNMVALASVQRSVRAVGHLNDTSVDIELDNDSNGAISRRRIADATGVPRTTVARSLQRLIKRKMVVERRRGQLQVPTGVVLQGSYFCDPASLYAPLISLFEQFVQLGVVRLKTTDPQAVAAIFDLPVQQHSAM